MNKLLLILLITPMIGLSQSVTEEFKQGYIDGYQQGCIKSIGEKCEKVKEDSYSYSPLVVSLETIKLAGKEYTKTMKERNYRNGFIEGYYDAYPCIEREGGLLSPRDLKRNSKLREEISKNNKKLWKILDKLNKEKKPLKRDELYSEYIGWQNYGASLRANCRIR